MLVEKCACMLAGVDRQAYGRGRGAVKLAPLRRHSRGEGGAVKLAPLRRHSRGEGGAVKLAPLRRRSRRGGEL
jgi:hypothetical protein